MKPHQSGSTISTTYPDYDNECCYCTSSTTHSTHYHPHQLHYHPNTNRGLLNWTDSELTQPSSTRLLLDYDYDNRPTNDFTGSIESNDTYVSCKPYFSSNDELLEFSPVKSKKGGQQQERVRASSIEEMGIGVSSGHGLVKNTISSSPSVKRTRFVGGSSHNGHAAQQQVRVFDHNV